jgi:glycosyltransferase involved in cell wall biosynthesis
VTIVAIFLNGHPYLSKAVDGVLAQTFTDYELILVDDGSTDGSTELARGYAAAHPNRVKYLEHPGHVNRGMSASRNAGAANGAGELLAFLDSDDVWLPTKLEHQVALFDQHPDAALVAGATLEWRSWNGGEDNIVQIGHRQDALIPSQDALLKLYPLGRGQAPCPSNFMVRRTAFDSVGGFEADYRGPLQMYEDQAFLVKIYTSFSIFISSQILVNYRIHDDSCMATTLRGGHYEGVRRHFLNWFKAYLAPRRPTPPVAFALWRARWLLDHPRFSTTLTRIVDLLERARWRLQRRFGYARPGE